MGEDPALDVGAKLAFDEVWNRMIAIAGSSEKCLEVLAHSWPRRDSCECSQGPGAARRARARAGALGALKSPRVGPFAPDTPLSDDAHTRTLRQNAASFAYPPGRAAASNSRDRAAIHSSPGELRQLLSRHGSRAARRPYAVLERSG